MSAGKGETMSDESTSSQASISSSTSHHRRFQAVCSSPPKRPAGRTKFRETRHPVFRGVRRRGRAGRWVCEVRVPGRRGCRLWLGTFDAADTAARAHDAAMLALCGRAACLNFADSAWLLAVPPSATFSSASDVQRAVAQAVEAFQLRREAVPLIAEDAMSATSELSATDDDAATDTPSETTRRCNEETSTFELDVLADMGWGLYCASLAEGLLIEPPAASDASCSDDGNSYVADVSLWSYWN